MKQKILSKIKEYQTIIIHRHSRPDMDAIGSQMGLYYGIKKHFPQKEVFVVGDLNDFSFEAKMDTITDTKYNNALVFVLDVSQHARISDERYKLGKEIVCIDHHTNDADINPSIFYQDVTATSACQQIANLFIEWQLDLDSDAATYLYCGMVTDSGRFTYINENTAASTFAAAAYVAQFNPRIKDIYDYLYLEPLTKKLAKNKFCDFLLTSNNVAYRKNTHQMIVDANLDFFSVSRGMVNLMAGIKEVDIWVSFTEDVANNVIGVEIRSRDHVVVDIAKKYGGGGHDKACGASLKNWEEVDLMLEDLNERAKQ